MAKEKSSERLEKKEKKEKRSEKDGVHKSSKKDKKKDKSGDGAPATAELAAHLEQEIAAQNLSLATPAVAAVAAEAPLLGALVPFAHPLADEKAGKKVLKSVKKGLCARALAT